MKALFLFLAIVASVGNVAAQNCDEILKSVKSKGYGNTYYSPSSTAISEVTFYDISVNYKTYYFAVVKFKKSPFTEYIYQVSSTTKLKYSMNYLTSAGEAFWDYIEPYNEALGCAPNFKS